MWLQGRDLGGCGSRRSELARRRYLKQVGGRPSGLGDVEAVLAENQSSPSVDIRCTL